MPINASSVKYWWSYRVCDTYYLFNNKKCAVIGKALVLGATKHW